ncbi:armadillo-type protein [Schizophyllum commune]
MDGPAPEEDFSSIPISDRLVHKNWKARVNAYEALVKAFQASASDEDPVFKPYVGNSDLLKKIATDSNVVAQEKGLECLVALLKFAGETAARTRETVVPALVEKAFGSTRAGTKAQATELALLYVEMENAGAGVVADILPGLSAKQPKAIAGCIVALREIVRCFGVQVAPPQPIMKALPKMFGHSDKTVRAEGQALVHVLYQYIGAGIEPALADLKPVQVKELHEAFEALEKDGKGKGTLKPERMTRAQAREAEAAAEAGEEAPEAEDDAAAALDDTRAFAEIVDIGPKLPPSWQGPLASSKWKERKEVLDAMAELFGATPRIKDTAEIGDIAKALALRIQSDANVACVQTAAAAMEHLAKGVMAPFGRYREQIVPPMIERLKERKASVTDAIGAALDAVFSTTTLPDIIPDLQAGLTHKNPQVKEGTLKFLNRSLSTATTPIQTAQIKPLAETLATLMEDSFAGARDEAAMCCGTLMKMVGERPLNPVMDGMADVRKAKVKEAFEKATVKCKAGGGPPKPPPAAAPAAAPKKKVAAKPPPKAASPPPEDEAPPPPKKVAKPPARLMKPAAAGGDSAPPSAAPPVKKAPPAAAAKSSKPPPPAPAGALDTFKYKHTPEDAEALAADMIPSELLTNFADSNWKTRIAALEEMDTWLNGAIEDLDAEVLVRALVKKGWSEKNFQVSAKMFGIFTRLSEQCPSFGRSCVALCTGGMAEKLGDMKLKKPAGDGLIAFAEKTSLQFVLNQAYEPLSKQKAPKVLADAIAWISTALTEFGIAGISLRSLIDFLKTGLSNSNAAVRTSATKTIVTVKLFAGASIKDLLEDLNPQLLNTITAEFDKAEGTPAPEPTRTSNDVAQMATTSSGGGKGGAAVPDALDDLFPRVELDGLLKGTTILADAKADAWKVKKEALEGLQAILDQGSNKRLKGNMGEIGSVLKARVNDSNKPVQALALDIVARIATGMGKPFEKHCRLFVQPVCTVLSDQKAPTRAAALATLSAIANACESIDPLVPGIASALETPNPLQKGTLLHWLVDWFKEHEPSPSLDLSAWTSSIVVSLDDRNAEVRKGAQAMLPALITGAGFDHVLHATNALKPASRTSAVPLINAARPAAAAAAPAPAPAKAAPKSKAVPVPAAKHVSPPPSPPPAAAPAPPKTTTRLGGVGVRRKLPTGTSRPESRAETPVEQTMSSSRLPGKPGLGLKRPGAARPSVATPPPSASLPFHGTNLDAKKSRLGRDASRWINEGGPTRKDLAELLQGQMEPHASKDLIAKLFSHDHNAVNDHMQGLGMICELYNSASNGNDAAEIICLANIDLPLKYVSIKIHEPQPNLISKCLDAVDAIMAFMRHVSYELSDAEAICFLPTLVYKLGDAREQVRSRVQHVIQASLLFYPYSRVFQILLDHGLKSKVAKARQGALDEMANIVTKSGMGAMEPHKACPTIASTISDKDSNVRKSALTVLSEVYALVGEKVWQYVGPLSPKDKTQLEERLRRVAGPSNHEKPEPEAAPNPKISRLAGAGGIPRSASPSLGPSVRTRLGSIARAPSPSNPPSSRLTRPTSPVSAGPRSASPAPSVSKATPTSPSGIGRPKSLLPGPSRFGRPRTNLPSYAKPTMPEEAPPRSSYTREPEPEPEPEYEPEPEPRATHMRTRTMSMGNGGAEDITITISSILSSDPSRSVDALKKIQKILSVGPEAGSSSPQYQDLAEHTEGLIETITLQMAHVFERQDELILDENFRLAKHLIQTLNNFCDHSYLAESLTVDILTSLLEELTLRLLETDDSQTKKVKDLSRFINMIILRLFATGRRMSIFRALFALLLRIVKPFPSNGTAPGSKEARVAELVLKCVWKLARNIPQDLTDEALDPVELFPAIEHFLQTVPPNEWRARATNKVPCGDMPLRTIKVIIQHVVAHYGDDVYDLLSTAFDDPSATIVYPYVYRILNSASRAAAAAAAENGGGGGGRARSTTQTTDSMHSMPRSSSPASSRPVSPPESTSATSQHHGRSSHRTSPSLSSAHGNGNGYLPPHDGLPPPVEEPDPDQQLLTIIGHISSETTGALHKEGITELHHFLKAYPHKRPRVDKMLEATGPAFRKYITRALASRAAEDQEREVAVQDTLSTNSYREPDQPPQSPVRSATPQSPRSPVRPHVGSSDVHGSQDKLSRLHDIFQYRSSTHSNGSSHGRATPRTSLG